MQKKTAKWKSLDLTRLLRKLRKFIHKQSYYSLFPWDPNNHGVIPSKLYTYTTNIISLIPKELRHSIVWSISTPIVYAHLTPIILCFSHMLGSNEAHIPKNIHSISLHFNIFVIEKFSFLFLKRVKDANTMFSNHAFIPLKIGEVTCLFTYS